MRPRKPSPSTLIALLALFVALGGSSYAALQVPRGSVGTRQLKNNAVTSPKVKNNSLLVRDFRASQRSLLRGPEGARGPQGPQGPQGLPGPAGASGAPGSALAFAHVNANGTIDAANSENVVAGPKPGAGIYCLDVTASRAPRNAVAMIDISGGDFRDPVAVTLAPVSVRTQCPAPSDALVATGNWTPPTNPPVADRPFYVVFN
jgi:hypothetical protein